MSKNGTTTVDDLAQTVAGNLPDLSALLPALPAPIYSVGKSSADALPVILVTGETAPALGNDAPSMRLTGARARAADTAADKILADALAQDGGALRLIPVTVSKTDDGRTRTNASRIESALDKALLRLTHEQRTRLLVGRASDAIVDVTVHGITVQATVPGMVYVLATGGAVKSHPIMGQFYRALTAARGPVVKQN